jgi:hypothetical protein
VRTAMHCSQCFKNFIAEVDPDRSGNYVIECCLCGHEHCRVIRDGHVTEERWESRTQRPDASRRSVWKADSLPARTTTAGVFLRERWLERMDVAR